MFAPCMQSIHLQVLKMFIWRNTTWFEELWCAVVHHWRVMDRTPPPLPPPPPLPQTKPLSCCYTWNLKVDGRQMRIHVSQSRFFFFFSPTLPKESIFFQRSSLIHIHKRAERANKSAEFCKFCGYSCMDGFALVWTRWCHLWLLLLRGCIYKKSRVKQCYRVISTKGVQE